MTIKKETDTSRRTFVKNTAKTLAAGIVLSHLPMLADGGFDTKGDIMTYGHPFGQERIKLGLVGCGGRGTGAVFQALTASKSVQLVAMGEVFDEPLNSSLANISKRFPDQVDVPKERQFVGLDAFKKVIVECDAVILATPPAFRPEHFENAIQEGKHVFLEKPLATDVPGYRKVVETGKLAEQKKLNVVVGLQSRYELAMNEMVEKIHAGELGEILSTNVYYNVGKATVHPRKEGQSELEYQLSNWHYFNWLWGGQLAGQAIHQIDIINWIKQDYPIKATGMGGRLMLRGPEHGEIFDHHYVELEYLDGTKLHVQCRQMDNCSVRLGFNVQGTKARADERFQIVDNMGNSIWRYRDRDDPSSSQIEQDVFIGAIMGEKPYVNDTEFGAESTMTTIMGRMAIESGEIIDLEKAKASDLRLVPENMTWNMQMPNAPMDDGTYAIPKPGIRVL